MIYLTYYRSEFLKLLLPSRRSRKDIALRAGTSGNSGKVQPLGLRLRRAAGEAAPRGAGGCDPPCCRNPAGRSAAEGTVFQEEACGL